MIQIQIGNMRSIIATFILSISFMIGFSALVAPRGVLAETYNPPHCCVYGGVQQGYMQVKRCTARLTSEDRCLGSYVFYDSTSPNGVQSGFVLQFEEEAVKLCQAVMKCPEYDPQYSYAEAQQVDPDARISGYYLPNPFIYEFTQEGFAGLLARIIAGLIAFSGVSAFIMFIVGGFKWVTSMGNAEKVESGVNTMKWAAIGILVTFASYALLSFLLQALRTQTSDTYKPTTSEEKK